MRPKSNNAIIFINRGNPFYLKYALAQARKTNPKANIILVGDKTNVHNPFASHCYTDNYFSSARKFSDVYEHISVNPFDYELFCFQRWFVLSELIKDHGLAEIFYADSDLLIFCDIMREMEKFQKFDFVCQDLGAALSPHCSFWLNQSAVHDFCSYLMAFYEHGRQKAVPVTYPAHAPAHRLFTDMFALHNFAQESGYKVGNSLDIINDSTYDQCLHIKELAWKRGVPYNKETGVRYNVLHCQGDNKVYMEKYCQSRRLKIRKMFFGETYV